jgi:Flp pilus assembly protein CpaB
MWQETADQQARRAGRSAQPAVTLQVSPEQDEQVAHARQQGDITLLLRNDLDLQQTAVAGVTNKDLLGHEEPKPVVRSRPKTTAPATTELIVYRGSQSAVYSYEKGQK